MSTQQRLLSEVQWLADNPHFAERPATIREFVGADYLGLQDTIRPGVMAALVEIFGEDVDPQWISVRRKAISTGAIGIGKCSTLDAMVNLSDGTYKRAGDIRPGDRTPGGTVVASQSNGIKPVYTVTTTWGQELELTGNHPVWVEGREWVHVEDLQPGDELRVHRGWEAENPDDHDADLYRLAGYLIADGGLTTPTPTWGKGNVALEQDMHEICQRRGWSMREMDQGRSDNYRQYRIRSDGDLRRLLVDLGMYGKGAAEKSVPDFVFRSSNAMIEQFLCAYLESDGRTDEHGAEFYSVSRDLLWGVQKLLLRLGVVSKLQVKNGRYKGEVHKSWRLRVPAAGWNIISQWDFRDEANRVQSFDYVDPDTVPLGLCGCGCGEETAVPVKNNRSKGEVKGVPKRFRRGHSNRHRPEVMSPTCRVESVTPKGEEETWAIQVEPTNHLYIEDILTHNTTIASIILTYCVHWCYCLRDPQKFFGLMPGSRIAFMLMSTSESQAKEVLFGDIKARIESSQWFQRFCDYDRNFKNQLRMAKNLWIVPGGSEESRFEGYNVLVGIIDEGDCVDEETEILTASGWKKHGDLRVGEEVLTLNHDTGLSEWQLCEEVRVFEPGPREVLRMEGKEFSSLTTLGHRWPVLRPRKRSGKVVPDRIWTTSRDLGFRDRILRSAAPGDLPEVPVHSDALVEMVAWFYTEGTDQYGDGKTVYIYQSPKNAANCGRIRSALTDLFGPAVDSFPRQGKAHDGVPRWREVTRKRDDYWGECVQFVLSTEAGRRLQDWAPGRVPTFEFLRSLTRAQLELFITVSLLADNNGERRFAQKDRDQAEAYAFACILAGRPVSVRPHGPTKTCPSVMWNIYSSKKDFHAPLAAAHNAAYKTANDGYKDAPGGMRVTTETYDGMVWCPRVQNGSWLARRNGTVYFTGNSHKKTQRKDYAEEGYDTISSRIASRFTDPVANKYKGLLVVIGQMKSKTGFMSRIYSDFVEDPDAAAIRMTFWESIGWNHYTEEPKDATAGRETAPRKSFVYDIQHKRIISRDDADADGIDYRTKDSGFLEVPTAFLTQFKRNPVKALRDLAGIPPEATDPFIALPHRITSCQDAWHQRMGEGQPVSSSATYPALSSSFRPLNQIKRIAHVDIAYSGGDKGDAMGIAMAHIPGIISVDGEDQPLIVFDFVMRIKAKPGSQIELSEMRRILRRVRDDYGFNLKMVTFDGFASVDSMQALRKSGFQVDYVSVDRNKQPYEDLREGIYDERILFPKYMTHLNEDDSETVNIIYQELSQLTDTGPKIDHPPAGSKDCADAMAACVSTLMQMPQWRRGVPMLESRASDAPRAGDVDSEDLAPVGQMLTNAGKSRRAPGAVPTFGEFTAHGLGESSPGVQAVKERAAAPFVGRQRDVSLDPFLR